MATTTIKTIFAADGSQLGRTIQQTTKDVDKMRTGSLTKLATTLGAAFGFQQIKQFATEAVKSFSEFDQAMRNVNTLAKQTEDQLSETTSEINTMAIALGKSPKELATALYDIVSAGFKGADALNVLEQATTNAIGGMTSTKTAAKALSAVLNAYSLSIKEAEDVSNIFQQTVRDGVITYEELATGIGKVLPTAAASNVAFDELGGAISFLTKQGMDADMAMISLNGIMLKMLKPTTAMTDAWIAETGVLPSVTLQTKGFAASMTILNKIAGDNAPLMAEIVNEKRALRGAYAMTGEKAAAFNETMRTATDELGRNKEAAYAAAEANEGMGRKIESAAAALELMKNTTGKLLSDMWVGSVNAMEAFFDASYDNLNRQNKLLERQTYTAADLVKIHAEIAKQLEHESAMQQSSNERAQERLTIEGLWKTQDELRLELQQQAKDLADEQITAQEKYQAALDKIKKAEEDIAWYKKMGKGSAESLVSIESNYVVIQQTQLKLAGLKEAADKEALKNAKAKEQAEQNANNERRKANALEKAKFDLLVDQLIYAENYSGLLELYNNVYDEIVSKIEQMNEAGDLTEDQELELIALKERQLEIDKERDGLIEGHIAKTKGLVSENENLEGVTEEIKNNLAGAKLPFLSKTQSKRWITFLNAINGVNANVGIDVSFMRMASANTLKNWAAFFNAVRGVNALVEVKGFSDADLVRYEALIKKISAMVMPKFDLPDFDDENMKIRVNWTLPDEYEKGIPIDVSALQEIGIDDIAKSLKTLAELKGVIWI